jgi:hypothetical protein
MDNKPEKRKVGLTALSDLVTDEAYITEILKTESQEPLPTSFLRMAEPPKKQKNGPNLIPVNKSPRSKSSKVKYYGVPSSFSENFTYLITYLIFLLMIIAHLLKD